ncbi:MAG: hypothetical protein ACE5Q6_02325 [Dehalococcoidia bacterium]
MLLSWDAKASEPCSWNRQTGMFKSKKALGANTSSLATKSWKTSANPSLNRSAVAVSIGVAILGSVISFLLWSAVI